MLVFTSLPSLVFTVLPGFVLELLVDLEVLFGAVGLEGVELFGVELFEVELLLELDERLPPPPPLLPLALASATGARSKIAIAISATTILFFIILQSPERLHPSQKRLQREL